MIRVGEKEIRPTAPVLFAALLYLCAERGRRVPRAALQELLFPEKDERSGAHSVRQLLYKLRSLGVPLETTASHTTLRAAAVTEGEEAGDELLPGYAPQLSVAFDEWVAEYRAQRLASARSRLLRELTAARNAGDNPAIARLAAALLRIDPLNEPATFARSEVMAVAGQVHRAVQLLKEYGDEVGTSLRLPADLLRKRIAERFVERTRTDPPLLGRSRELALLLGHFARASTGRATMSLVWGEAGIGKSRLVQEFRAHVLLKQAVVVTTHCQPHDSSRPMGALVDLVPRLLQSRGALGIAPEAMRVLRGLTGGESLSLAVEPDVVAARIRVALEELILCVCSEAPLVMIVEDAHWQDEASTSFLRSLLSREVQIHIVLTSRTFEVAKNDSSSQAFAIRLEPLAREDAIQLLNEAVGTGATFSDELRDRCIDLAAGHPLFICSIAEHLRVSASAPSTTTTLRDLLRQRIRSLTSPAQLLLRCLAGFGLLGSHERLRRALQLSVTDTLLALQEVTDRGLVVQQGDVLACSHDVLTSTVISDIPGAMRVAIMERVATVLEEDGTKTHTAAVLWACSECWEHAQNADRAAQALHKCALYASEIGQPMFAIKALEKAQRLCSTNDLAFYIEETLRVADTSVQVDTVISNAERLHAHLVRTGKPSRSNNLAEFTLVNLKRRLLFPIWNERGAFERLALDPTAKTEDRLRAARAFILAAEEELALEASHQFYERVISILPRCQDEADRRHLDLVFHSTAGDPERASELAAWLLEARSERPGKVGMLAFGDAAYAMFRAGNEVLALNAHEGVLAESRRLSLSPMICGIYAERAAMIALHLGQTTLALDYHRTARDIFSETGDCQRPSSLSNAIDFAIAASDVADARHHINILRSRYASYFTPNRERVTLGQDLIVDWLQGVATEPDKLTRAQQLYQRGQRVCECDSLAVGLALSLTKCHSHEAATDHLRSYLTLARRDRFALPPFLTNLLTAAGVPISDQAAAMHTRAAGAIGSSN